MASVKSARNVALLFPVVVGNLAKRQFTRERRFLIFLDNKKGES